jgi:hypothetical protein
VPSATHERTSTVPSPDPQHPTPDGPMTDPQTHLDADPSNDPAEGPDDES